LLFQDGIGLAIEDSRVSAVHLKSSLKGARLSARAVWPIDSGVPLRQQAQALAHHLKEFVSTKDLAGAGVHIGLSQEKILLREIELPLAARENLADTIRYELDRYLPLPEEDLDLDFQILSEDRDTGKLHVLLAAAKKADLAACMDLAAAAGIGVSGIEPIAAAILNGLHDANGLLPASPFALAVCDRTDVVIVANERRVLRAARVLPAGGGVDARPARIRDAVEALQRTRAPGEALKLICGGPALDEKFLNRLRGPGKEMAWEAIGPERLPVPSWELLGAYGLALKAFDGVPVQLNLLPPEQRKRASRAGRYLMASLAAAAVLAALGWIGSEVVHQRLVHSRLDAEIQQLDAQVRAVEGLLSEVETLEGRVQLLEGLRRQGVPALDIIRELSDIIPETAWIREFSVLGDKVILDGYAESSSELIPLLDASPRMTDVTFLSAITKGRDGKEKFRIGFTISPQEEKTSDNGASIEKARARTARKAAP
jgi:general secretion pathway protein L